MKSRKLIKQFTSVAVALSLAFAAIGYMPASVEQVVAAETTTKNIAVDINGSETRGNLKSPVFSDWTLTGNVSPATYTQDGVTFTLTTSTGDKFSKSENKTLITGGNTPYLTTDGAFINTDGTSLTLQISGLPAGMHTITTWHSYYNESQAKLGELGRLAISVDGVEKTTVAPTAQVTNDLLAGLAYIEFEAKEGQAVEIKIQQASDSTGFDCPVLNAFEIDGAHPTLAIKNVVPEQNEGHHDPAEGLSWTGGDGAVAHDLYFGTDEYAVSVATTKSAEYKGRQSETKYAFPEELSHMEDYYWRVDEIDANGNVLKGNVYHFQIRHLAFPTAEGYGRFAKGGRGGYVYEVTTLEDNGLEGSLRYGVETLKGARIIVFRVGGVIELKSRLCFPDDGGNVYVAGQTAPGDGITLINYDFGGLGSEDVVIRNVRVRVGDMNGQATGGMGLGSCDNSIVDHCSIAWSTDEGFSSRGAKNITFQYNIIAEALNNSVHYNGTHAFAASISGNKGSFHHNLLANCTGRNWSLAGAVESDNKTYGGSLDISNNVVYNYRNRTTDGGVRRLNFVNNYYKMGAASRNMQIVSTDGDQLNIGDHQMMYVSGNMLVKKDGTAILKATDDAWAKGYAKPGKWSTEAQCRSDEPFFPNYITLESAEDAYNTVLENAGAVLPKRDYLDSRYIEETKNGTYNYKGSKDGILGIIDSQKDVGGYPNESNFKGGEAPLDSDHDGMPDAWESEHDLNPNNAADGSYVSLSAEGYTNVEMYLNELMGDPLVWNDGSQPIVTNSPKPVETAKPTASPTIAPTETVKPTETVAPTATATVAPTETVAPTPAILSGDIIKTVEVKDETYYVGWSIDSSLKVGDLVFGDRDVTFVTVDESLVGSEYIVTACDSKFTTTDLAVVTAAKDMILSVGFDARMKEAEIPAWAADFTKTELTCVNNKDVTFVIYQKEVKAGESVTLGAQGRSKGVVGYIVMATDAGAAVKPTESVEPTETVAPTETVEPTETVAPTETVEPTETVAPTETVEPTETVVPTETVKPTETVVPTETVKPTETVVPTTPVDTEEPGLKGDVNFDGLVNAEDALLVLKHAAKLIKLTEKQMSVAKMDENESIDAVDALIMLKIAAKLI